MASIRQLVQRSLDAAVVRTEHARICKRNYSRLQSAVKSRTPSHRDWKTPASHPRPKPLSWPDSDSAAGPSRCQPLAPPTFLRKNADAGMTSESTSQGGEVDFDASISEEDLKEELPDAKLGPVPSSSRKSPQAFKRAPREHLAHHIAMKEAFPDGWAPTRKLSRAAMDGIRTLHKHDPDTFSTPVLAEKFRISPEAVRRILKSSWQPSSAEQARLAQREARLKQARIEASKEREREERLKWRRRERLTMV